MKQKFIIDKHLKNFTDACPGTAVDHQKSSQDANYMHVFSGPLPASTEAEAAGLIRKGILKDGE